MHPYDFQRASPQTSSPPNGPTGRGENALWVGNIPSNTTVMRLRDYFSNAMPSQHDLLSISYNPDARYAFVNFRTDSARMLAIQQAAYHLLDGKRLDCRIRQNGSSRSTKVNYGLDSGRPSQSISISSDAPSTLRHKVEEMLHFPEADSSQYGKEKYYILKSYSLETLYQSLASGLWHVPKRHVERLNNAFQTASKVYLIFSVNGSGRFFGYATMRAEISDEERPTPSANGNLFPAHPAQEPYDTELTESGSDSQSEPTSRRPSLSSCDTSVTTGSISYEPQRRKIIWHASSSPHCPRSPSTADGSYPLQFPISSPDSIDPPSLDSNSVSSNLTICTQPCRIKWLSAQSVPFEELRGLRNVWNSNKEIHVARNVTAVEPAAAAMLLRFWKGREQSTRLGRNGLIPADLSIMKR
ncbi:hypothetical protein A1O7_02670 [Cladophialophora yegresii CBS 114405]|uniref:YTH domain-containing protein n=1 Tax=Cladophialophora yegresii CBS 114405 TaxID=1182544 RepID=W9W2E7_9EURO|nr:uncharacterized protein A1O7_02670 [Cladophialophora yegresii CBS 114405]EXJ62237.1 hypothetical protein A1O7_02670 [Cladophialophora yegresii CBS 114405]